VRRAVLFSRRCFKQRGALYRKAESGEIQLPGGDSGEAKTMHQLP
jgi:hypothetical protein